MSPRTIQKLYAGRKKSEDSLYDNLAHLETLIRNKDRKVKIEHAVEQCKNHFTTALGFNEQLYELTEQLQDKDRMRQDIEAWTSILNEKYAEVIGKARQYLDGLAEVASRAASKASVKSKASGTDSRTSSQRKKDLMIAKLRREEVERQNASTLLLAKQKFEIELLQLEEDNRQKLVEAKIEELELTDDISEVDQYETVQFKEGMEESGEERVQDWLDNAPVSNTLGYVNSDCAAVLEMVTPPFVESEYGNVVYSSAIANSAPLPLTAEVLHNTGIVSTVDAYGTSTNCHPYALTDASVVSSQPLTSSGLATGQAAHAVSFLAPLATEASSTCSFTLPQTSSNCFSGFAPSTGTTLPAYINRSLPHSSTTSGLISQPVFTGRSQTYSQSCPQSVANLRNVGNRLSSAWQQRNKTPAAARSNNVSFLPKAQRVTAPSCSYLPHPPSCNHNIGSSLQSAMNPSIQNLFVNSNPQSAIPFTSGGTVYYAHPATQGQSTVAANPFHSITHVSPPSLGAQPAHAVPIDASAQPSNIQTLKEIAEIFSRKDHLPEWKLSTFDGNPLTWHEWYGQFKSTIDAASITDDIKLTYLKTLVSGKAKQAISEFSYCGSMYREALRTLERKFGQPQAVVSAHLDKLANFPPLRMHNSDSIINYASLISGLVGVFKSLSYDADLESASLMNQAIQKLPPNMREAWSLLTVKRGWLRPTLLDFNDWLKEKAEAHDRMRLVSTKSKIEERNDSSVKQKTTTKTFASNSSASNSKTFVPKGQSKTGPRCIACKSDHPLWLCNVFKEKTATQRAKLIAENDFCFSCINGKHKIRECPNPRKCKKDECGKSHNTLLHGAERVYPLVKRKPGTENKQSNSSGLIASVDGTEPETLIPNQSTISLSSVSDIKGLLQVLEVELSSPDSSINTFALCDSGCSHSWISSSLANSLGLHGKPLKLTVSGINSTEVVDTQLVEVTLKPLYPDAESGPIVLQPFVREQLFIGSDEIDVADLKVKYAHLEPLKSQAYSYKDVQLILGQDVFHAIRPLHYFKGEDKTAPFAVQLPIGWVLSGALPNTTSCFSTYCFKANVEDSSLSEQIRLWYDMESYGAYKQVDPRSESDARALQILDNTTFHDGTRYQVGMLWSSDDCKLPNNYFSSLIQLKSLEKRLERDRDLRDRYSATIEEDLEKGYVIKIGTYPDERVEREWYLPHHPVLNPNKPGKVRRVLNGASKFHGWSLNKALLTGPDLLQSLLHVLLRFRQFKYAMSADIEGMFLQVGVIEKDQPCLRFLWREAPTSQVEVFQYTRHVFGAKDSPTCANYALQRTASDNRPLYPDAAQAVFEKFYMDDYLDSCPSFEQAQSRARQLVELLKLGGFKLTKFISNTPGLVDDLLDPCTPEKQKELPATTESSSHVLGLKWDHNLDSLVVSRGVQREISRPVTQRKFLSLVSAVFDPIGLVAPFTVKARLILKDVWRLSGQQWDNTLPPDVEDKVLKWASELPSLSSIAIPRSYFGEPVDMYELHLFGDSSQDVFSAVAFLRGRPCSNSSALLAFVFGRARVAPMKALSIPKLELQASLLAARLKEDIIKALTIPIDNCFMWTDSTTVLQWLHSIDKQPIFVANRVSEILEHTTVDQWHHVATLDNPADAGTRGLSAEALMKSCWVSGPSFLKTNDWPFRPNQDVVNSIRLNQSRLEHADNACVTQSYVATSVKKTSIIEWQNYSSYFKLVRVIAYMRRFIPRNSHHRNSSGLVDPIEFSEAENCLQFLSQRESFADELKQLQANKTVSKGSRIAAFSPFIGPRRLLRSTGRIKRLMELEFDAKHPIMLDGKHPYTVLMLRHLHDAHFHQGIDYMRALVQQHFAVLKLRSVLRSIQLKCVVCRKRRANTLAPMMADLPKERLAYKSPPFTNTGVDYFGPLYVSVRRSTEKRWGFLFTCLTTRAVHIEVVGSLDTSSCVMGIERFIARRGYPSVIWSDNGTNFVGAEKELLQCVLNLEHNEIQQRLLRKKIRWKFNPPSSPHHGGSWERMIRSVKKVFYAILGNRRLTEEVLTTTLCLVEQTLNARPLTPVSSDATDLDALTPNHFLLGAPSYPLPSLTSVDDFNQKNRYARAQAYANAIWTRWLKEYVPDLNKRNKWNVQDDRHLCTGTLVWIVEDSSPRGHYPMARVQQLNYGSDGIARSAVLTTKSGTCTRPVVKLVPVLDPSPSLGAEDVTCDM